MHNRITIRGNNLQTRDVVDSMRVRIHWGPNHDFTNVLACQADIDRRRTDTRLAFMRSANDVSRPGRPGPA